MPSSMRTVYPEGVPSSSMVKDPRRSGKVPSSTTVTPLDATRSPMSPENAEVFLRLKSPSSPCPTASCSMTPGQPDPSTTVIAPAGAGTVRAGFHAIALADHKGDVEPHQRADIGGAAAIRANDLHRLPHPGERRHHLAHARV